MEMPKDQILALDIGTRSVVGVVLKKQGSDYIVVDHAYTEHRERAMLDGQIHDIEKVRSAVCEILEKLEEKHGKTSMAAIAAAGRSLKTERASAEIEIDIASEIDKGVTDRLQMLAVQEAQSLVSKGEPASSEQNFYTVGHSVVDYKLDGSLILNPEGHRGNTLSVEIIATFLPHIVVDSLYAVLQRSGLDVLNLTLEPIAAMNIAIPKNLRLLNLALVDIGAGTSDIAISRDGTIYSYGMVASAGDKITEVLSEKFLLDFNSAEALKISASTEKTCKFTDVLGMQREIDSDEVAKIVEPNMITLVNKLAEEIVVLNGKSPSAVFLIGGGSQLPGIARLLAEELKLAEDRVAVKGAGSLPGIVYAEGTLEGPEFITPIGIGITAFEERDHDFVQVNVNDSTIRMLNTKQLQVSDALLLTGYNARSLLSERGESIFAEVDGENREIKGDFGEPAKILINGKAAALDSEISNNDKITVIGAKPGSARVMRLDGLVNLEDCIYFGDTEIKLVEYVSVNSVNRTGEYILKDGDKIVIKGIKNVLDLMRLVELENEPVVITKDGLELSPETPVEKNSRYSFRKKTASDPEEDLGGWDHEEDLGGEAAADLAEQKSSRQKTDPRKGGSNKGESRKGEPRKGGPRKGGADEPKIDVVVNGEQLKVPESSVFVDLFDIIGFDTNQLRKKGQVELKLNGEVPNYLQKLQGGDTAEIHWHAEDEIARSSKIQ